jgi:hypothetical protein
MYKLVLYLMVLTLDPSTRSAPDEGYHRSPISPEAPWATLVPQARRPAIQPGTTFLTGLSHVLVYPFASLTCIQERPSGLANYDPDIILEPTASDEISDEIAEGPLRLRATWTVY